MKKQSNTKNGKKLVLIVFAIGVLVSGIIFFVKLKHWLTWAGMTSAIKLTIKNDFGSIVIPFVVFAVLAIAIAPKKEKTKAPKKEKTNTESASLGDAGGVIKRDVTKRVLLSVVTLGIYGIVWQYKLIKSIKAIENTSGNEIKELLCLYLVPLYSCYWWATRSKAIHTAMSETVYVMLSFGVGIVARALLQNDINTRKWSE